jgi:ABC-2 type transport system permease protein
MTRRAFVIALTTAARRMAADRGGMVVAAVFYFTVVFMLSALWRAAAGATGGEVVGYSAVALTWYVAASEAATVSLNIRMIEEIADDIAAGAIAVEMLRPASVLAVRIATQVGRALPRLAVCGAVALPVCLVAGGRPPNLVALALSVPSLVLAITCNLLAQHAFSSSAFWIRDARSTWFVYQKFVFVVGGMLIPLEVLPPALEAAAKVLPFMAMAYAPARLASGHVEPWLLAVQAGWLVVLAGLAHLAFTAGERRLQVVGG